MSLISNLRRRWVIKRYARRLGPALKKHFGRSDHYTPGQVRSSAQRAGLPMSDVCYGYAMFLTQGEFDRHHQELGEQCDYGAMRQEIAAACFSGNSNFTVDDVMAYGEASGDGGSGGGFSGSDGDGGGSGSGSGGDGGGDGG